MADQRRSFGHRWTLYLWLGQRPGRVTQVKAYVGYKGKKSVGTAEVQCLTGTLVVTPSVWVNGRQRAHDFAIVKLSGKFKGVKPFNYTWTPLTGNMRLGVVGYPADKSDGKESGALMYEQFKTVQFDLHETHNQLAYTISTYAGQSGSPVLHKDGNTLTPLATHVAGSFQVNLASPIGPAYLNPYETVVDFFFGDSNPTPAATRNNVEYYSVRLDSASESNPGAKFVSDLRAAMEAGQDILPSILQTVSIFCGPVIGPAAALAGGVLGYAGCLCESVVQNQGQLPQCLRSRSGYAERGLLAESCLQYFLESEWGLFNAEKRVDFGRWWATAYLKLHRQVSPTGPQLLHGIKEPATRIALDALRRSTSEGTQSESVNDAGSKKSDDKSNSTVKYPDEATKAFADRLLKNPTSVPGEETAVEFFGDLLKSGLKVTQTVAKLAPVGLSILSSVVGESDFAADGDDQQLKDLTDRALLGQACLDALIESNPEDIDEPIIGIIKEKFLRIGRAVISTSAQVIDAALPIIASSLKVEEGEARGANASEKSGNTLNDTLESISSLGELSASQRKLRKSLRMKTPAKDAHIGEFLASVASVGGPRHKPRSFAGMHLDEIEFPDAGQDGIAW